MKNVWAFLPAGGLLRLYYRTIGFGLTLGILTVVTFLVPLVTIVLIGAIATSVGAVTCRAIIRKKRPADRDLRNAALGVIGLIALIIVVPPLAALVLSGI